MNKRPTIAVVLGGALEVWSDLNQILTDLPEEPIMIGTNVSGRDYRGKLHHWASFHVELFPHWSAQRAEKGLPPADNYWTVQRNRVPVPIDVRFIKSWGGSSGLVGAQVGLEVADRVVLCGVPLTPSLHYDRLDKGPWLEALKHQAAWSDHFGELHGRVKSMGGWTQELLGVPSPEWINGED